MSELRWAGEAPPFRPRVVIAAPHPDDEVLGCAGIMRWLQDEGIVVEVVAVTDGDASHARSDRITRPRLVERRQAERREAFARLGIETVAVTRLGLPDAEVAGHERDLATALGECLDPATTLIVPWRHDGHPDHEAVARAGLDAARAVSAGCLEAPIWARVRGTAFVPTYALELGTFRCAKRFAAQAFESQIRPLGPEECDGPVVHPHELEALTSGIEWLGEHAVSVGGRRTRQTDDAYFDEMWATGPDPWDHAGRFYEHRKYALTRGMLARARYGSVFEPGCATGLLTAALAPRADRYLATDRHARAVEVTRTRVAAHSQVRVEHAAIPAQWPDEMFDLVVLSEVLYYLTEDDVRTCLDRAAASTRSPAELVAVHYRMPVEEHALLGDEVHALIHEHGAWDCVATHLEEKFVLEGFTRR